MPELPEVETVKRGLNLVSRNQFIQGGEVLLKRTIAHPVSITEFINGLSNKAIASWYRRGKYLLAEFSTQPNPNSETLQNPEFSDLQTFPNGGLAVHLRMTGQLLWVSQDEPVSKHTRVRLFFPNKQELRFVDQRTFGKMWGIPDSIPVSNIVTGLQQLGPEPFSEEFSTKYLKTQFQRRQRPIKTALLDQKLVAGVGNIYADETLFLSGIDPRTPCAELTPKQIETLHFELIKVLKTAIDAGGTTVRNFLNVSGVNGNYAGQAWVYNRGGQPCRVCQTPIERLKLAGRSAHYCPRCQS
ncbi:DNA-formamidopyrimidine glycosylase [Capilliphycus salinus ALCB114379]|uniref:DNA-formamidopyrimidine glycosylase n=1 Tax=Capilliphycus salinus TaxID=2768948 RepID=UPI0039A48E2A